MKTRNLVYGLLSVSLLLSMGHADFTSMEIGNPNATRYKVQTNLRDPSQMTQLSNWLRAYEFDIAGMNWKKGEIEVITNKQGIAFLNSQGLTSHEVQSLNFNFFGPDARYLNPTSLNQKIQALAKAYPNLTRVEEIGKTLQGRPILALLLSDTPDASDPRNLDKPSILFDGEHHAREVMTPEVVMDVADTMLKGFNSNAEITSLLHNWNIWLVPMVNPDGSNIVFSGNSMWRKNARASGRTPFGVDVNRNYSYKWNACSGSSGSTYAQDYRGASSASEPETQALIKLAQAIRPAAYLSYHSYSELVLYPYGCNGSLTPENVMYQKIAKELASRLPSDHGGGNYTPGSAWEILYGVDGDSMSYMYAAFGALSYTFEINMDFQPDYSLRDPTVRKHRNAWMYFLNRIDRNLLKVVVVDAKTNQPLQATLGIDTIGLTQGEPPYQTNTGGRFFKVLDPGHYVVSVRTADGRAGQIVIDMNGQPQTAMVGID